LTIFKKIFGDKHSKDVKKINPLVDEINEYCEKFKDLSEEELKGKTGEFKTKIKEASEEAADELEEDAHRDEILEVQLEAEAEAMEDILPEAFAVIKIVCTKMMGRTWKVRGIPLEWDMIPYDVQLVGGVVLHDGKIAEMATGEGKTLVATLPLYLNALTGRGVHLVTVNDYLASRDSEWMGEVFKMLGLTVGCILGEMEPELRREMYNCDITYGTNNEFGFDYLRDNMSIRKEDQVQRGHHYAIVDEVDSVLIDEARTPLIISGPVAVSTHMYDKLKPMIERAVKSQTALVNKFVMEIEELLKDDETQYEAGIKLLQSHRGAPKNKKLTKILNETGNKKLMRTVENDYMRDKKMVEIDDTLYYTIDEKSNVTDFTDMGRSFVSPQDPDMFVLPDMAVEIHDIENNSDLSDEEKERKKSELQELFNHRSEQNHNISQLLKAYSLFEKDVQYVLQDGKVQIVDEFTGRLMPGRRYSDGLHQAIEAKENVKIERESQTLATITLQNYFRMYRKLAGMTGTAITEASEFFEIYKLDCTAIPTNKPIDRTNYDDEIYRTKREKYNGVILEIEDVISKGRSVLVGTISVDVSETLSRMLKRKGIRHSVLNAKQHQSEAEIVSEAGRPGMVTIATNMAGRGTDIKLREGVKDAGGLHVVATERHESRRIDLQLRGRCARQGDPGSTKFFLSLEDDLMRLFAPDRIISVMDRLGLEEGEVIKHRMITKSIERAQKKVEAHNFSIRKHLLEYDDVMNKQREIIYKLRSDSLHGDNLKEKVRKMISEIVEDAIDMYTDENTYSDQWQWDDLRQQLMKVMLLNVDIPEDKKEGITKDHLEDLLKESALEAYDKKEAGLGEPLMRDLERFALLRVIDELWKEHLYEIDQIKEGINLRAYGQKDPLIEYKKESFNLFQDLLAHLNEETISLIFKARIEPAPQADRQQPMAYSHAESLGMGYKRPPEEEAAIRGGKRRPVKTAQKVGRNEPCPCGSGKKYKKCHGAAG